MSVEELQGQLSALESRNASLVTKLDDAENEVAFHKKRYETAIQKAKEDKEEEIGQSAPHHSTHPTPLNSSTARTTTAAL